MQVVQIQLPSGAWQYVKRDEQGRMTHGIYPQHCILADEIEACRAEYPQFEFRAVAA